MSRKSRISRELKNRPVKRVGKTKEIVPSISYFTLYRFASTWDKLLISLSMIASFTSGAMLPFSISLVANLFQTMIDYSKSVKEGKHNNDSDAVFLKSVHSFGIAYSCIGVLIFVCSYLGSALMNITAIKQVFKIRREYLTAILNQDFAYFDLHPTGDFASKMADDVIKLEEGIGDKLSSFVHSGTAILACVLLAMLKGWKLALLCLITAPLTFMLVGLTGRIANRLYKREAVQTGLASSIAQEVLSSIRTVYAFNGQKKELERYQKPLVEAKKIYIKKEMFTGLSMAFLYFCVFCSYGLAFYFGIFLIIKDPEHYNADVMFSVFFGVMTALGNLGMVGSLVRSFGLAKGAGAHIFHLLDNVPTINPLLNRGHVPSTVEGNIVFKNVVFEYPSRPDVPVLKGLSMTIRRGQAIAVVGSSGSGKSSIIKLISRYYDVFSGSVCLDGIDVRQLSVRWLRSQIGLVRQEPVLFNTTIRENIRYGRQAATDEEVEAAAAQAYAHHFIIKLPKMYETMVGELGTSLSGGQKQRIAIARALVRNPAVLLLDEATSALDTASEAKVQLAIKKAAEGRTTVVVAHRLSTIRDADLIHVMMDGSIVETGNHEQLMANKRLYYDMVMMQEPHAKKLAHEGVETALLPEEPLPSLERVKSLVLEEDKESKVKHVSFWRVLALNCKQWPYLVVGTLCSIFIGFSSPMFIVAFGDLFGSMSHPDTNKMWEKVQKVSLVCALIGAVTGASNLIESISFGIASARLVERLRTRMFAHLLRQQLAYFDVRENSTGALCAKLSSEPSYVQGAIGHRVGVCLQGVGSISLAMVLAMWFEWRVGLVALSALPLVALVVYQEMKATKAESYGNAQSLENSTKIAVDAVSNVHAVVSVGREAQFVQEYVAQLRPALAAATRAAHCKGLVEGLSRSMFNFINAGALTFGGHLMVNDGVPYENILITTQSLQMASHQAQSAFSLAPHFEKGRSAASRVIALLNTVPTIQDPDTPHVSPFESKGEASLKGVEFRYPSRPGVQVLRGLDLQVGTGKTIALVGRSGCGKSTVIQLLERYYDPDEGVVCLDDIPVRDLLLSEARRSFGLVSQEPTLFDCSIAQNIAYGDNEHTPSHEDIVQAAKLANIHNFVVSLPEGYETNIGSKGTQLSGGQKQRVAIARALIRQPKILLLDEATSALDTESEKVVQEALNQAKEGRTCVMIAHRLSTVRDADVVCYIDAGLVAETGSHQQLLDAKGLYYNLHSNG